MRRFLLAAAMFGTVSGAQAADMPDLPFLRGAFTDGLTTAKVNWQGFYVGGQAGLGTSDMNFTGATKTIAAHLLFGTAIDNIGGVSSWPLGGKVSTHGNGIGAFAGYNAQWEDVVLGVEFSYMHGKFGGSQTDSMSRFFDAGGGYTDSVTYDAIGKVTVSDMASARLRAGYAYGSFLPYLFGGVALGRADIIKTAHIYGNQINPNVAPPFDNVPFDLSATDARNSQLIYGYSFGLGVDVMLCAGLFLRAEWEYNRFTSAIDTTVNTGRVGLGYKF
jgi:outer membrane immunogenic protein